jgi:hypothetical protein
VDSLRISFSIVRDTGGSVFMGKKCVSNTIAGTGKMLEPWDSHWSFVHFVQ